MSIVRKVCKLELTPPRSPDQVSERLDRLIADIRTRFHGPAIEGEAEKSDVLLVAHGHILRAFAMRWIGRNLQTGVSLLLESKLKPCYVAMLIIHHSWRCWNTQL